MERLLAVQCIAALTLVCATAVAEGTKPLAELELVRGSGTRGCLDSKQLVRNVERRLRRSVFKESGADLHLRVAFERQGDGWVSLLTLSDSVGPLGKRELSTDAPHCSALDDSLALVVALLVDTPPSRPPPEIAPETASSSGVIRAGIADAGRSDDTRAPTPIRLPAETLAPRDSVRVGARAAALAGVGVLPGIAFGAELSVHIRFPRFARVAVLGELLLPKDETVFGADAGAQFSAERIGLELCSAGSLVPTLALSVCGGQRVGRVHVSGFGFDENEDLSRLYYSLVAGLDASASLAPPLRLAVAVRAEVPLTRDRYTVRPLPDRPELVHQHTVVAGTLRAGLEAEF